MSPARQLHVGSNLILPADFVTEPNAVLGNRGSGKTYTAKKVIEEMLRAKLQVVIVDPMSHWYGLRSSADGKSEGFPIPIFGGPHGDVPLDATSGELMADLVADGLSAIFDIKRFKKVDRRRFVRDFCERLLEKNKDAMHLVLEEASIFAPQGKFPEAAQCLGAVEEVVQLGRGSGIGITVLTQRTATLNKNVLELCENLFINRTTGPNSRKAIQSWLDVHGDDEVRERIFSEMPTLSTGTCWFYSPNFLGTLRRVEIEPAVTFDSSATPKAGQKRREPKMLADIDTDSLSEEVDAIKERHKENDPKELKKQVGQLRTKVSKLEAELANRPDAEPEVKEVPVPTVPEGLVDKIDKFIDFGMILKVDFAERIMSHGHALKKEVQALPRNSAVNSAAPPAPRRPVQPPRRSESPTKPAEFRGSDPQPPDELPPIKAGARRILEVLASWHPAILTRSQVGVHAKFRISGGTFKEYMGTLKRVGFVSENHVGCSITEAGLDFVGITPGTPKTPEEALDSWRASFKKAGIRKMLDAFVEAGMQGLTRPELAEKVDMEVSGGTFKEYLGILRRNGLVQDADGDVFMISEDLYVSA